MPVQKRLFLSLTDSLTFPISALQHNEKCSYMFNSLRLCPMGFGAFCCCCSLTSKKNDSFLDGHSLATMALFVKQALVNQHLFMQFAIRHGQASIETCSQIMIMGNHDSSQIISLV